ncbi:MAK10-like protein [Tanacetum coccineum]|uniref:MAK10-like protein n=1 Tax=Tanacetum coccineum TaxID=301880 RepID=A0ABQ4ZSW8_9ASTR
MFSAAGDGVTSSTRRRHNPPRDGVTTFHDDVSSHDPVQDLEYSLSRRRSSQHLKDFLKLVDSLDLDDKNRERTRLRLFQFFLRDQASNWLEHLPIGCITTWEDLTTHFLAQFFPPGRTAKLRNDILMFQQHHEESLSKNLALYDHEGWNDIKVFTKPVNAISTPQGTSKTPDRRLLELEDHINFLLKGSRLAPTPSSTHTLQAYVEAFYSNSHPQNQLPKLNPFTFRERTGLSPQPQALRTTFEARVQDYMAAHTE